MQLQVVYLEALKSPRLFRKSNLEAIPRKGSFGCLASKLVLVPTKANPNREGKKLQTGYG